MTAQPGDPARRRHSHHDPDGGIGANTALLDAATLRQALTEPRTNRSSVDEAVGAYERRMRSYANPALALSSRNARNAATTRRMPWPAFRTLFRVADSVRPVKRAVFPTAVATTDMA